ncbi:MAG: hypothetical protein IJE09_03755 [Oscillospiraceae bacterium]|nr:hypothetical protein [Oscillospiraceae bacterium]
MKKILSFMLVLVICISTLGINAYAGLDMSSWEAFKAQAEGRATPTPAPTPSLAERLKELAEQVQAGSETDAVSSATGSADTESTDSDYSGYQGPGLDIFKAFKDKYNTDTVTSASPSGSGYDPGPNENDIIGAGFEGQIKMPHPAYFLDDYEYAFIFDKNYGLNVRVYRNPDDGMCEGNLLPVAWHGSEVTLLAKRHDFYCIIYHTNDNAMCIGWVHEDNLCSNYPGDWYGVGERNEELFDGDYYMVRPEVEWSEDFYVDSYTRYSRIWSPGNVTAMTLEYQVIGRNDKKADGGRDVYINLGDGWRYIGAFQVNKALDPVRYTIYFNYPVPVKAVAVLPQDMSQQGFDFRLCVSDMFYVID